MHRLAAALLLTLSLLAPLAAADQDEAIGPASVRTQNARTGDGCAEGGNGSESRYAEARVDATPHESVVVLFSQSCYAWNYTYDDGMGGEINDRGTSDNGVVMAGRSSDGNAGPVVQAGYMDAKHQTSWAGDSRNCWSYAYLSGPGVSLGCYPDGGRWPMAPELP